ncbi:MAG TPA: hypothetical protein DIC35_03095 [Candidatus Moranbacteria bacterium]|nr:hypothetical protein [Candidatus Moranbacteria bacterium]
MKLSPFWHYIEKVDSLWHSLNFEWRKASQEIVDVFKKRSCADLSLLSYETKEQMNKNGFFSTIAEDEKIIATFLLTKRKSEIKSLYLIMSTNCNLACSYCLYAPSQSGSLSKSGKNLTQKEIFNALRLFQAKTCQNKRDAPGYWEQITFYGGEPLLNMKGLKFGIEMIDRIKREERIWGNLKIIIDTNGTLIDDDFIDFAKKNQLSLQISIDGPREIHDSARKFKNGKGTFDRVHRAMEKLSKEKVKFLPLITVSPANINFLPKSIEWLCSNFAIDEIAMNLLMHTGGDLGISYGKLAAEAMLSGHNTAKRFNVCDPVFDDVLKRFAAPNIASEICGAGIKIAAFPGGNLHACQALENCGEGLLGQTTDFDEKCLNWQEWKKRSRFSNQNCLRCPVLGLCGGGCAASAFVASGSINDIDPYYCEWIKKLFELWIDGEIK